MTDDGGYDASVIPRLERMIGADVVGEILDLFFETTPRRIAEVRSGNAELAAQALHSLKSSAGMLGGTELAGLAEDLERLAMDDRHAAIRGRLDELDAAVARLSPRLRAERERVRG